MSPATLLQVSSILTELNKYWPSYDGANDEFWSHEYEKHGTCAEQLTPLATELEFFSQTVGLAQKYDVVAMLSAAGITPGKPKCLLWFLFGYCGNPACLSVR